MKNKKSLILIIVIAILVIAIAVLLILLLRPKASRPSGNGVNGVITDGWDDGINSGGVEPAGIQVPGYKDAKMNAGDKVLHLSIGNPESNQADFYATVQLEDGTVLYESGLIEPGQGVTEVPLNKTLDAGTYQAYVVYQAVTMDDAHEPMNSVRSAFTLYVE